MSTFETILNSNKSYSYNLLKLAGICIANPKDTDGLKITVSGQWTGKDFILNHCSYVYNRLMNRDLSVDISYAGSILLLCNKDTKLYIHSLCKLALILQDCDYRGFINLHCLLKEDTLKAVAIDTNVQFTYPLKELSPDFVNVKYADNFAIGVRFTVAPFPHSPGNRHIIIEGVSQKNLRHLHFYDMSLLDENSCDVIGNDLGIATARGLDIRECQRRVYRTLSNLEVENIQYRTDIGYDAFDAFNSLKELKWI